MASRDPETGQFVSGREQYQDYEVATTQVVMTIPAADLDGTAGSGFPNGDNFEGIEVFDYDELVDRNEELHLLRAAHGLTVYSNSTATADGSIRGTVEISSSPARQGSRGAPGTGGNTAGDAGIVNFDTQKTDSIDLIGRVLTGFAGAPFSDGATGVGGAGSAGEDREVLAAGMPGSLGRFHPRDELFLNGVLECSNIDDAGIGLTVDIQHVYGVSVQ